MGPGRSEFWLPPRGGKANASVLSTTRPGRHQFSLGDLLGTLDLALDSAGDPKSLRSKHFTRKRSLTVPVMVGMLLTMVSDSGQLGYRYLLQKFWVAAKLVGIQLCEPLPADASAFCKARQKLSWRFIQRLCETVAAKFEARFGADLRWKGRQVFAADGVKLALPREKALDRAFGRPKGTRRPMIAVLSVFNVLSRLTQGLAFGRYASSERALLAKILDRIPAGSILLLDRGFHGLLLLNNLVDRGIDFVARVPASGSFAAVTRFVATGHRRGKITLTKSRHHPRGTRDLQVRIERVREGKEEMVLLTSLPCGVASRSEVIQLYRWRWAIETEFKVLKIDGFGEDSFHSRTPDGIKQEIWARVLFLNLSRCLLAEAAVRAGRSIADLAPKSARAALGRTETLLVLIFPSRRSRDLVPLALTLIVTTRAEKRKERHFPRVSSKPRRKWGLHGAVMSWAS